MERGYSVEAVYGKNPVRFPGVRSFSLDLENPYEFRQLCEGCDYAAIIHAAAMSRPDACESSPARAFAVNVEGTRILMDSMAPDTRFIYISTDMVFDGSRGDYSECDSTEALNVYARTKLEAERLVMLRPHSTVVRIAKLYGWESPFYACFTTWMRTLFEKKQKVPLFKDQFRSFIYVGDIARGLERLLDSEPKLSLYHLGGPQRLSRTDLGRLYADVFSYDVSLIDPVSFTSLGGPVKGQDCSLSSERFHREFGFQAASAREGLMRLLEKKY